MARGPFPQGADFGRASSGGVLQPNHSAETSAGAASDVARAVGHVASRLRESADRTYQRQGEAQAAEAIARGETGLRGGFGIEAQAFDGIMREHVLAQRVTAYGASAEEVERANPNDPAAFATGMDAVRAAFKPTGDPELDARFSRAAVLADGAALSRVRQGQERFRQETASAALYQTVESQSANLARVAGAAPAGAEGSALVTAALGEFTASVVKHGPREAFELGGVSYPADPSRTGVMGVDDLAKLLTAGASDARSRWIVGVGQRIGDPVGKRAYAANVRELWQAGDPMFAGLSAAELDQTLGLLDRDAARAEADAEAAANAAGGEVREALKAAEFGGAVDWATLRTQAEASGDAGLIAEVEYRAAFGFSGNPGDRQGGAGLSVGAGFSGAVDFLLDHLEGPGLVANDNGAGSAQWGITRRSHPEAWRDGKVDRTEAAGIYREYWTAIGADDLEPDLAFAAFTTAVVAGPGVAQRLIQESGGDLDRFWALEMAHFEGLARQDPGKYADDLPGWRSRQGKVRGAVGARRTARREADGYAGDPLGHAMGSANRPPLISVTTLDPGSVFAGADGVSTWKRSVLNRRAEGQTLARRDGVPERIFTDAETTFYKEKFEDDPGALLVFTAALASTVGPDVTRRELGHLGRQGLAPADLHIAGLAIDPVTRPAAGLAVRGRQMRLQGAGEAVFDDDESIARTTRELGTAFSGIPDLAPVVANVARDMAVADQAAGRLLSPGAYVNSALGATSRGGHTFGGVTPWAGDAVILPTWLRQDGVDEWVQTEARAWASGGGPVYANGQPIPGSRLAHYRLRAVPGGYRLVNPDTGAYAVGADGRPFQFTPNREAMARRHPSLVAR